MTLKSSTLLPDFLYLYNRCKLCANKPLDRYLPVEQRMKKCAEVYLKSWTCFLPCLRSIFSSKSVLRFLLYVHIGFSWERLISIEKK